MSVLIPRTMARTVFSTLPVIWSFLHFATLSMARVIPNIDLPPMTTGMTLPRVSGTLEQDGTTQTTPFATITPSPMEHMLDKRAISLVNAGWSYVGCWQDHLNGNVMNAGSATYSQMNPTYCQSLGQSNLVSYVGVEAGTSCYWDNYPNTFGLNVQLFGLLTTCNQACPSPYQTISCGGSVAMQIYRFTGTYTWSPSVIGWNQIGCYTDFNGNIARMFPSSIVANPMGFSICASSAAAASFSMFNLEGSSTCWMGNTIASPSLNYFINPSLCSLTCAGNPTDNCGGATNQAMVYSFTTQISASSVVSISSASVASISSISSASVASISSVSAASIVSITSVASISFVMQFYGLRTSWVWLYRYFLRSEYQIMIGPCKMRNA
jgi:WSC domain-containing protein